MKQERGVTFSKAPGSGANFYIIYIFIYFDAYMSTKVCRMMN